MRAIVSLDLVEAIWRGLAATPNATYRPIAADLCEGWAGALIDAGFDAAAPTAWLAEGVLLYLPAAAERLLVDTVHRLAVGDSAFVYEIKLGPETRAVRCRSATTR